MNAHQKSPSVAIQKIFPSFYLERGVRSRGVFAFTQWRHRANSAKPAERGKMRRAGIHRKLSVIIMTGLLLIGGVATPAVAAPKTDPTKLAEKLVKQVTASGANRHLIALQRIAAQNGGNRAANTPGYDASVDYVAGKLRTAGLTVTTPEFTYEELVIDAALLAVAGVNYPIVEMTFSPDTPVGGITAPLLALADLPADATPGCEAEDYNGLNATGTIVVVRRGGCNFSVKVQLAADRGAVAAVVANNTTGAFTGTLGTPGAIPAGGIQQEVGTTLLGLSGTAATVDLRRHAVQRTSRNVIAQTTTGRQDNVVMVGAHLDSVPAGPGINDNGTGTAGLLEIATKLGPTPKANNAVRFAFWGAEELGLLGSNAYVNGLTLEQQIDISLYLNFDMIGSKNAGYFVFDGDNSDQVGAGAGPVGSAQIEKTFTDFFANRLKVPTQGTDFDGRSDYGRFIFKGIPAGGLFTGAEVVKTPAQVQLWGGTPTAFDSCYHQACDTIQNVDRTALDRNLDAAAWATGIYGYSTEEINGVPPRQQRADLRAAGRMALTQAAPDSLGAAA